MTKRHVHADLIHAWAEGAEIQHRVAGNAWADSVPSWEEGCEYRIKPEKKPDVVRYTNVYSSGQIGNDYQFLGEAQERASLSPKAGFIRYIIDGETGKLKSAEVL